MYFEESSSYQRKKLREAEGRQGLSRRSGLQQGFEEDFNFGEDDPCIGVEEGTGDC